MKERDDKADMSMLPRFLVILFLTAAVLVEGYYIFVLRDTIDKQTEDLKNISMQLQSLKNERAGLHEELSSIKKLAGDDKDGNTPDR